MPKLKRRVGVLVGTDRGTSLTPGLLLKTDGSMVEVLIEQDGAPLVKRTCKEYADTPLPATLDGWAEHYARLDAIVAAGRQFCRTNAYSDAHTCYPAVTLTFDGGTRRLHWCQEHQAEAEPYRADADPEGAPAAS